jgi:hypothetical protein
VAEERDRTSPDLRSPSPHDDVAEANRRNRYTLGRQFSDCARSGAEQAKAEDGAPMRVHAARRGQHSPLCLQPDGPEAVHIGSVSTGSRQLCEKWAQRLGTGLQHGCIHVGMAAAIDVAYEAGLGPRRQLTQQRENRLGGDQLRNDAVSPLLRRAGGR